MSGIILIKTLDRKEGRLKQGEYIMQCFVGNYWGEALSLEPLFIQGKVVP